MTALLALLASLAAAPANADSTTALPTIGSTVTRDFDPPDHDWLPGHRGVDLAGMIGQPVIVPRDGQVSFVGVVAGRPVITVDHGGFNTTYEPVDPQVTRGEGVTAGQIIGYLIAGHEGCPVDACLHWGMRKDGQYHDPMSLLGLGDIRLLSAADLTTLKARAARLKAAELLGDPGTMDPGDFLAPGSDRLLRPVDGPISSPFGMRIHPINGQSQFHDGMDIAAACGATIRAAATGQVSFAGVSGGYGNRVVVNHNTGNGANMASSYSHASSLIVSRGQEVSVGQVLGFVGSTGTSTGCHLHWQVWRDGQLSDPADWLD
ncbi:MAG: M23 family metallopeptidase [Propionibacteriaceae bacterium]|nr:M23 family metallopeptidase [Propionibacteriaceae bacterium]